MYDACNLELTTAIIYSARVDMTRETLDLPAELWGNVFTCSFQVDPYSRQNLTCVNHRFNAIACATPQLWTRLYFTRSHHCRDLELTRTLLQRAGCLPLDVYVSSHYFAAPLAELLGEYASRFRFLQVRALDALDVGILLSLIGQNRPAPLLEHLSLLCEHKTPNTPILTNVLHPCPRLTSLTTTLSMVPSIGPPSLFSTITSFILDTGVSRFTEEAQEGVRALLSQMPHLQVFKLSADAEHGYNLTLFLDSNRSLYPVPQLYSVEAMVNNYSIQTITRMYAPLLQSVKLNSNPHLDLDDDTVPGMFCRWISSASVYGVLRHLSKTSPLITHLELNFMCTITPVDSFSWIFGGEGFPFLEVLSLQSAFDLDNIALPQCTPSPALRRLELLNYQKLPGNALIDFGKRCSRDFQLKIEGSYLRPEDVAILSSHVGVEYKQDGTCLVSE